MYSIEELQKTQTDQEISIFLLLEMHKALQDFDISSMTNVLEQIKTADPTTLTEDFL